MEMRVLGLDITIGLADRKTLGNVEQREEGGGGEEEEEHEGGGGGGGRRRREIGAMRLVLWSWGSGALGPEPERKAVGVRTRKVCLSN